MLPRPASDGDVDAVIPGCPAPLGGWGTLVTYWGASSALHVLRSFIWAVRCRSAQRPLLFRGAMAALASTVEISTLTFSRSFRYMTTSPLCIPSPAPHSVIAAPTGTPLTSKTPLPTTGPLRAAPVTFARCRVEVWPAGDHM